MIRRSLALTFVLIASTAPAHAQCWLQHVIAGPVDWTVPNAVATAPGRLVLGQPRRNPTGSATVRDRVRIFEGAPGTLVEVATLESSLPIQSNASFGHALDLDGDWLAVGDPIGIEPGGGPNGAVHLYERTASGWLLRKVLFHPTVGVQFRGGFGIGLDLDGDTLVVGAPGATVNTPLPLFETGAAFVFQRTSAGWQFQQTLEAARPTLMAGFGFAVALQGDELAIGAPGESLVPTPPLLREGAVHMFQRSPGGAFAPLTTLHAAQPIADAGVGYSLAREGELLIVGAPWTANGALYEVGAAHVFERTPAGAWLETALLSIPPIRGNERFGESVRVRAGEIYTTSRGLACAWRFTEVAGAWTQTQRYTTEAGVAWPVSMPVRMDVTGDVVSLSDPRGATVLERVMTAAAENGCAPVPIPGTIPLPTYLDVRSELRLSAPTLELAVYGGSSVGNGLLFYGFAPASIPLGTGLRCVGGPVARVAAGPAMGGATSIPFSLDLQSFPISTGPLAIPAGTPAHFQYWFRTLSGSTHLTNSLVLTFCP